MVTSFGFSPSVVLEIQQEHAFFLFRGLVFFLGQIAHSKLSAGGMMSDFFYLWSQSPVSLIDSVAVSYQGTHVAV